MNSKGLISLLKGHRTFQSITEIESLEKSNTNAWFPGALKSLFVTALSETLNAPIVLINPKPELAYSLYQEILFWSRSELPVLYFSELDVLPFERLTPDQTTTTTRLRVLESLSDWKKGLPAPIVVASLTGIMQKTLDMDVFKSASKMVLTGENVELGSIISSCFDMGYQMENTVEMPGNITRRGGILDVFPPCDDMPSRIELFGNEIDTIRKFHPVNQRSESKDKSLKIIPASEVLPKLANRLDTLRLMDSLNFDNCSSDIEGKMRQDLESILDKGETENLGFYTGFFNSSSLLDYLPSEGICVLDGEEYWAESIDSISKKASNLYSQKQQRGELPKNFPSPILGSADIKKRVSEINRRIKCRTWAEEDNVDFASNAVESFHSEWETLVSATETWLNDGYKVIIVTHHDQRLTEILREREMPIETLNSVQEIPSSGVVGVIHGVLSDGFKIELPDGGIVLLTDSEIFGVSKVRRPRSVRSFKGDRFISGLIPGTHLVHVEHGIAKFNGTEKKANQYGDKKEYLVLEYLHGDKIYVPTDHLDRVTRYVSSGDRGPVLTRLGTQEWERLRNRAKESAKDMAKNLLNVYASREFVSGHAFAIDSPWQIELESSFPFVETPDQAATILDVKSDMESVKPMDRLVSGDVGYGKTEIALRASFKAVMDGKQVAVLVPTTVLAQQHYSTFYERLRPFPVKIEVLSRFRTNKEQKNIIDNIKSGVTDVVIGTHRLLQKDVEFKDLGLFVVDEEQRFGVDAKEKLRRVRQGVDTLTLSATPIPRTLHMALAGIRDLSTMDTPPEARLPVNTFVSEYSDEIIRQAILRELDRGGQVFFVHNRIHSMSQIVKKIGSIVPEATIDMAHGRMKEDALEATMMDFTNGKIDVLVCTTIIESGLDMPRVNTLIINRADLLGLAQLYQLRGRVGRGSHRAYCYLLVPESTEPTMVAQKRLKAIMGASELGSGLQIAMRDLEIRGAGNLLGAEQSGHMNAIGFELYSQLLSSAVEELKFEKAHIDAENTSIPIDVVKKHVVIDLAVEGIIPDAYISDLPTRLGIYQRLVKAFDYESCDSIQLELVDRFGKLPGEVENLIYVARIKILAREAGVDSIIQEGSDLILKFDAEIGGAQDALQAALGSLGRVGLKQIRVRIGDSFDKILKETLNRLKEFRDRLIILSDPSSLK